MKKKNKPKPNNLQRFITGLLFLAAMLSFISFNISRLALLTSGSGDLRNRVVGARLLMLGKDPYFFQWKSGISEKLLDPLVTPNSQITRTTVTPTVLMFHTPIAPITFINQITIWFYFQWALLFITILLLATSTKSGHKRLLIIIIGLFFSATYGWRLHLHTGQFYILYTFLLALSFWVKKNLRRNSNVLSGFLIGVTAALRPPYLLMLIPLLLLDKLPAVIGFLLGGVSAVGSIFLMGNVETWGSYVKTMIIHSTKDLNRITRKFDPLNYYPSEIEGVNFLHKGRYLNQHDSSIKGFVERRFGFTIPNSYLLISFLSMLLVVIYKVSLKKRAEVSPELIFAIGTSLTLLGELFIPASRYAYNNIQILIPLTMIVLLTSPNNLTIVAFKNLFQTNNN